MFADLHLHSIYSDGTDTPDELISLAVEYGTSVISIADHDSITAYDKITNTSDSSVTVIPAVEISAIIEHSYLHMLGYHINVHFGRIGGIYPKNIGRKNSEYSY